MDNFTRRVLEVAKSRNILNEISIKYPNIGKNMSNSNLINTIALFTEKNYLHNYSVKHSFEINRKQNLSYWKKSKCVIEFKSRLTKTKLYSKISIRRHNNKIKKQKIQKNVIKENIKQFCNKLINNNHTIPENYLNSMKQTILRTIYDEYMKDFSEWSKNFTTLQRGLNVELKNSYFFENYFIVWSCVGSILINEMNSLNKSVKIEFMGALDTKCLILNRSEIEFWEENIGFGLDYLQNTVIEPNYEELAIQYLAL